MGKFKIILLTFLILLLSGCNSGEELDIVENIKFNEVAASYTIDRNTSDCELLLYGNCNKMEEKNFKELNNQDILVSLIGTCNEKQVSYSANIVRWEVSDSKLLNSSILLHLSINNYKDLGDKVRVDKIIFRISNSKVEKELKDTYINAYDSTHSSMSIMEAPVAPKGSIDLNKEHTYSYKILDTSGINRDLSAKVMYPDEMEKYIEIDDVVVNRDENTELQIKNDYKNQPTKVDLEKIRVYNVECTYILKEDTNFVFQPLLELQDAVENQSLVPFDAICFFNNKKR